MRRRKKERVRRKWMKKIILDSERKERNFTRVEVKARKEEREREEVEGKGES